MGKTHNQVTVCFPNPSTREPSEGTDGGTHTRSQTGRDVVDVGPTRPTLPRVSV